MQIETFPAAKPCKKPEDEHRRVAQIGIPSKGSGGGWTKAKAARLSGPDFLGVPDTRTAHPEDVYAFLACGYCPPETVETVALAVTVTDSDTDTDTDTVTAMSRVKPVFKASISALRWSHG